MNNLKLYRFVSKLIDGIIFVLLLLMCAFSIGNLKIENQEIILNILAIIIYKIYFIFIPLRYKKTLGKKILKLSIVGDLNLNKIIIREPFFYCFIGIIIASFSQNLIFLNIILWIVLIIGAIELILFYLDKDYWNLLLNLKVEEE